MQRWHNNNNSSRHYWVVEPGIISRCLQWCVVVLVLEMVGAINLTTLSGTSTGDITVGVNAAPFTGLELEADVGPIGNGGTVNLSSGNNLTVPANAYLFVGPYSYGDGNGGNINLTASTASRQRYVNLLPNLGLTNTNGYCNRHRRAWHR